MLAEQLSVDVNSEPQVKRDVAIYVNHYLPRSLTAESPDTSKRAAKQRIKNTGAMFLWVRPMLGDNFNTGHLEGTRPRNEEELLATIDEFPSTNESEEQGLDHIYGTILSRLSDSQHGR